MFLLYTSDFHFSADNSKFEIAKKRLKELATTIVKQGYNIDVFIFTGDFIDARSISIETIREMFQSEDTNLCDKLIECIKNHQVIKPILEEQNAFETYCKIIIQKTNELYKKTRDVLKKDFLDIIGVTDPKKMIICCGNHDILRFENSPMFRCEDGKKINTFDASKYEKYYESFLKFGNELLNLNVINQPKTFTIDEYSFLVIDSNIVNEHGKACIQCFGIESQLKKLSVESRGKNIAISHKPFFDCCENVVINYNSKSKKTISEKIKERCSFVLFGDKHGRYIGKSFESEEMLFGSPLTSNDIHYCILKSDDVDGHLKEYRNVYFDKNEWHFSVSNIEIIVNYCEKYFSKFAKNYIGEINIRNILSMDYDIIETLFKNIARRRWLNEYEKDCLKTHSFSFKEITDYLNDIYDEKKGKTNRLNLFNFRGRPSTGKTFLSNCLFCYLTKEFYMSRIQCVPMYFNLNFIQKECSDSYEEYFEKSKQRFDEFIEKCDEVKHIYDANVLCIIDGLEEKNCYNSRIDGINIENYIIDALNDCGEYKYILAFDQTIVPLATDNLPQYKLVCDFLYFLRRLDVVNLFDFEGSDSDKKSSIEDTLKAYFKICPYKDNQKYVGQNLEASTDDERSIENFSKIVLESLLNLHMTNINYMFLHNNITYLANANPQKYDKDFFYNLIDILDAKHADIYSDCKDLGTYGLCPVAYNYYINGLTYDELKEKYHINFRAFLNIKDDEELLQYLTAIHYVNSMQKISNGSVDKTDMSIFSCFIPRNISLMIRWYIARNKKLKIIDNFVNYLIKKDIKIPYQLKSALFYLAGFLKLGRLLPLVKNLKIDDSFDSFLSSELIIFNKYCVERSEEIAEIACCRDDLQRQELKRKFINKLFEHNDPREMNRVFQSLYYGDNTLYGYNGKPFYPTKDIIFKGWDFHNTFLTLIAKFDFSLKKGDNFKDYILIDLDLFTLCDIIYNRLQSFKTCNSQVSMYYNSQYKDKAIATLKRLSEALSTVVTSGVFRANCQLNNYFNVMIGVFNETAQNIANATCGVKTQIGLPYGSPRILLNNFLNSLNASCLCEKKCVHSIRFRSAYIALFFLPDKLEAIRKYGDCYKDYDKNLIVALLLLDDTEHPKNGTGKTFDILAMNSPCGFGNLTEYFNCLYSSRLDYLNINRVVAKDINNIAKKSQDSSNEDNEWTKHLSKICEPIYETLILKNIEESSNSILNPDDSVSGG